jgi:uncharacterized protein RhaS with RHS repeats
LGPETALYGYRLRQYDAGLGRFLQEDPMRFSGGTNFYSYVDGNPTGRLDPFGLDWLDTTSNFAAGAGDFLSGGYMNSFGFAERVLGHRAVPLTQFARKLGEIDNVVDPCSTAYAVGEYAGAVVGTSLMWATGINGGANSVFWSSQRHGANTAARALGTTLEQTPIGGLLDFVSSNIIQVPQPIWMAASATFAANATGNVQAVIRAAGPVWSKVELPILAFRNIPIIYR